MSAALLDGELDQAVDPGADRDLVIATEGVDVEPVAVGVGVGDAHGGREAVDADRVTARGHGDRVASRPCR